MAYCRLGPDCDVYLFANLKGRYEFVLSDRADWSPFKNDFTVETAQEALQALKDLRWLGLRIDQYAFDRLEKEIAEETGSAP